MADIFSRKKRSDVMSKIRSKNTLIEMRVFKYLSKSKIYFQRHYKRVPGSPDIALPSKKKAVFIDGDFWHGYNYVVLKIKPPRKYWVAKIKNNIKRDKMNRGKLARSGWKVLRIWEHSLEKDFEKTIIKIVAFLK